MAYTEKGRHIKDAAEAHSDLNIFAAVAALMESSLVSSNCFGAESRIVHICHTEQAKCIARYDKAIAKAGGGTYGK